MNIKNLLKISVLFSALSLYNLYVYMPLAFAGEEFLLEHEEQEQAPVSHELEQGTSIQEQLEEQQKVDQSSTSQASSTTEPIKIDTEEQRVISLSTQEGGPAKFSTSIGSIEVTSSKNIISTVIEAIRKFINTIRGVRGFEAVTPQLESLDKTINDIARKYKIDDLRDLTPEKLSTNDLQAIQYELGAIAETLSSLPNSSEIESLKAELNSFAKDIYKQDIDISDLTDWKKHLINSQQSINWIEEITDKAREQIEQQEKSGAKSPEYGELERTLAASNNVAYRLTLVQQALNADKPVEIDLELKLALDDLKQLRELNKQRTTPLVQAMQFQSTYSVLVTARAVISKYISSPDTVISPELKTSFVKFLSDAKDDMKAIAEAQKSNPSLQTNISESTGLTA